MRDEGDALRAATGVSPRLASKERADGVHHHPLLEATAFLGEGLDPGLQVGRYVYIQLGARTTD